MTLSFLQSAGAVVVTLGMVILVHEFGHFIVCRLLGVRVERFAFGFGAELFGVTDRLKTRFSVCAVPLGGYVKPAGENLEECTGARDEYYGQNWRRRLMIVFAGPMMNYVLAWLLFAGGVFVKGVPEALEGPVIGGTLAGYPAESARLAKGDEVLAVAGARVESWDELARAIHAQPGKEVQLSVKRGGDTLVVKVVPRKDEASGRGLIGITPMTVFRPVGVGEAAWDGVRQCYGLTAFTVRTIASKLVKRERPDLAGPVGIAQMVSHAARSGLDDLVFLIGLISVAIGFFNLLPIPLLDGGHAVLYCWEGLSGRKLTPSVVAKANNVGVVFLLFLLAFATYNDVARIVGDRSARKRAAVGQPK
ncbi:MAG: site-2 protease family protein [Elusimicrobia bacterium]|nr:site-2 protease family protein [Elusimicrobiota bacterium]